jgi:nucleoid DNA-binding protein
MKKAGRPKEYVHPTIPFRELSIEKLCETLFRKGSVSIPTLGIFSLRKIARRKSYHNFSKKVIVFPAHYRINFEPCNEIKKLCQTIKK